ncbi:oligopeptide transporter 3-like [Dorcoceras hygrometricum]|uniref:Oligopeptide transporter 3-like n=1 Tax=Dorcoceras hygrometricum TaxID=472368 RepID=A0A2Z7DJN6_9LAMI|nr:oligopeptide transporter 3-like [Dorcoceras hygrometricum]
MGGEQLKTSCKKREMKYEFCLLNDILAKTVTVKAGSFDVVTHERFLMMSSIHGGVKGARDLELGESKEFPPLKILTAKTVGTYVAKNMNIAVEEVADEPVVKKAAPNRRPAPAVGPLSDIAAKEEQILAWAETDSLQTASGTPTTAIDLQVLAMLSDVHRSALKKLLEQMREHKLEWTRLIDSKLFEEDHIDRGAINARSNTNIRSICWIRFLVLIDGSWIAMEGPVMWEMKDQKAALSQDFGDQLAAIRNDLLKLRVESQQNFQTLSSKFSEIIAYINRGGDAKKGEISRCPQPPPDNRSRPGDGGSRPIGGGSRSEPQIKRGSGS